MLGIERSGIKWYRSIQLGLISTLEGLVMVLSLGFYGPNWVARTLIILSNPPKGNRGGSNEEVK